MGDAGDILKNFIYSPKKTPERKRTPKKKCPDGVNREVFELQRDNESEFGQQTFGFTIEAKPSISFTKKTKKTFDTKAEKWMKREFTNSSHNNPLFTLKHWDKESNDPKRDYYFTKFNKKIDIASYTTKHYKTYYSDPQWTKEQTDLLLDLCKQFSLRFIVITDRFSAIYPGKTIEDLKNRYYFIARTQIELKKKKPQNLSDMHIFKYKYNQEHEIKRKEQAKMLFNRSPSEIEEEKKLFSEYKRIESFLKKQNQDTKKALAISDIPFEDLEPPKKKRKRDNKSESDDINTSTSSLSSGGRGGRRDRGSGVFVRSSRMQNPLSIGNAMMKKVDLALDEFNIPKRPIPTAFISKEYNDLRQDIVTLLELQILTKKKLFELEFYRKQLQIIENEENNMKQEKKEEAMKEEAKEEKKKEEKDKVLIIDKQNEEINKMDIS